MGLRTRHGNSKRIHGPGVVFETPVADELPLGIAAPPSRAEAAATGAPIGPLNFRADGSIADRATAVALQRRSTEVRNRQRAEAKKIPALLRGLGLSEVPPGLSAAVYKDALDYAQAQIREYALTIGGGTCGIAPSSIIGTAALQLAASKAAYTAGDFVAASRFGDAHRNSIAVAWDLAAKQAIARQKIEASEPHDALMKALSLPAQDMSMKRTKEDT